MDRFAGNMAVAGQTDVGQKRDHNEDTFLVEAELGLFLVCDGMGGHAAGEVASALAAETIADFLFEFDPEIAADLLPPPPAAETPTAPEDGDATVANLDATALTAAPPAPPTNGEIIRAAVLRANQRISSENRLRGFSEGAGMGTTVAGVWLAEDARQAYIFHVGDSRVYLYSGGALRQLTVDHTLFESWRAMGGQGPAPKRNIIMRALGPMGEVEVDVSLQAFHPGDLMLVCSDGLSSMAEDDQIRDVLAAHDGASLDAICQALITLANQCGGKDNVTVVLGRWA